MFTGEGAEDVGGPFREHLTEMCGELMSEGLPLFVPPGVHVAPHMALAVKGPGASGAVSTWDVHCPSAMVN